MTACALFSNTPKIAMKVPAATAVPITPATFGPIACISRKLVGSASAPTFWDTRAAIGTADTPAEPISGLTFPSGQLAHQFTEQNTCLRYRMRMQSDQGQRSSMVSAFRNASALVVCSYGSTQQNNNDVHQGVGCGVRQLTEQRRSHGTGYPASAYQPAELW